MSLVKLHDTGAALQCASWLPSIGSQMRLMLMLLEITARCCVLHLGRLAGLTVIPSPAALCCQLTFLLVHLQLDQQIVAAVRKVHEHKRRRAFYLGFSQSPVNFINALVASQGRDLRVMRTDHGPEYEAMRRSDTYKGKWVEDAVLRHLHKRLASGA